MIKNDEKHIYCRIMDNGEGRDLKSETINIGIGIKSMKTRTELMGGNFTLESNKGKGFVIKVNIPIKSTKGAR